MATSSPSFMPPLFKLDKLLQLQVDPLDEVIERRRDAAAAAAAAATSSYSPSSSPPRLSVRKQSTIVSSAVMKVGDASILALVVESNSIILRHWLSDGSQHKVYGQVFSFFNF